MEKKLGSIKRVMIDKLTGKVAYAVMTFGGFLGIGDEYRALPWSATLQRRARRLRAQCHGRPAPLCARARDGVGNRGGQQ